jgi:hypothetical protein
LKEVREAVLKISLDAIDIVRAKSAKFDAIGSACGVGL